MNCLEKLTSSLGITNLFMLNSNNKEKKETQQSGINNVSQEA